MPIETVTRYDRAMLRARPDALFVFGDNLARAGRGGQARECRGEPNAVGVPTKRRPSMDPSAFFSDADFPEARAAVDREFLRLVAHLRNGGTVVMPADGIGTGLADLPRRAPRIHAYIQRAVARLHEIADEVASGGTGDGDGHPREA